MKITNEEQAKAAKKLLDAHTEASQAFNGKCMFALESLEAAIAAYEQERELKGIELTPSEEARLRFASFPHEVRRDAQKRLEKLGLEHESRLEATNLGRAYLAQKPREERKLNYDIVDKHSNTFICAVDFQPKANNICKALNDSKEMTLVYEVREVK